MHHAVELLGMFFSSDVIIELNSHPIVSVQTDNITVYEASSMTPGKQSLEDK